MSKKQLVIQHDLSKLSAEELTQYLRDVSEFIGLDPDLNALDTIWMQNEGGPGQSLVVYARRGTAEILRNKMEIEVSSLTQTITPQGSIVFTAIGKALGRQEIAIGSKYVAGLQGKALDDAIMTASTRALRRLTMQFTSLGILDESEVGAIKGSTENPAAGATLAGSPVVMPPLPQVPANNGPGKDVTTTVVPALPAAPVLIAPSITKIPDSPDTRHAVAFAPASVPTPCGVCKTPLNTHTFVAGQGMVCPDIKADTPKSPAPVTPVVAPVTGDTQPDIKAAEKPKRARKKANTVCMDGPEPEVVSNPAPAPAAAPVAPPTAPVVVPDATVTTVPSSQTMTVDPAHPTPAISIAPVDTFPGKPNQEQMDAYRKRVSVYTSELPSSESMGSVQKMRAFITKMSGAAPQFMTVDQWEEMLGWFEQFVAKNAVKGLVKYINDSLGVK